MARTHKRSPLLGPSFDCDQMNEPERIEAYIADLEYYRPCGFSKLVRDGRKIVNTMWKDADAERTDAWDFGGDWKDRVEDLLTAWARRVERHEYISYGGFPDSGDVGFYINVDGAQEDADLTLDAGESVPRGFSGLLVTITDHGNVSAFTYSRGRKYRELFAVV
jgi:hypothetical protein